jgi:hypothetical protein
MAQRVTAHSLVKDTKYIANDQFTIPQLSTGGYDGLLTEEGTRLLNQCLEEVNSGQFKDTFISWEWEHVISGSWFEPNDRVDPIIGARGFLNARNNRVIVGLLPNSDKDLLTSSVRFWGDGWCKTISGSLYAIPPLAKRSDQGSPLLINEVW